MASCFLPGSLAPRPPAPGHSLGPGFAGPVVTEGEVSLWARSAVYNRAAQTQATCGHCPLPQPGSGAGRSHHPHDLGSPSLPTCPPGPDRRHPHLGMAYEGRGSGPGLG